MDAVRVALLREVLAGTEWLEATRRFAGSLRTSVEPHGGGLLLVGGETYEPWHLAAHLDDEAAWSGLPQLSPTLVRHRVRPGEPAHLAVGLGRIQAARRGETLLVVTPDSPGQGLLERVHDARRAGVTILALEGGDRDLQALAHDALTVPGGLVPPGAGAQPVHAGRPGEDAADGRAPGAGPDKGAAGGRGPGSGRGPGKGAAGGTAPGAGAAGARAGADPGAGAGAENGAGEENGGGRIDGGPAGGGRGADILGAPGILTAGQGPETGFDTVQHLVSAAAGENRLPGPRNRRGFRDRLARLAEQLTEPPPTRW